MPSQLHRICVFAGSQPGVHREYLDLARSLGEELVRKGLDLVYGGSTSGMMGAVADAVLSGGGQVTGVIPRPLMVKERTHQGLTALKVVDSMHERKALMARLSDGFIAVPGGWGTLDELFEILTWSQLGMHQKPSGLLDARGYFQDLIRYVDHSVTEGFVSEEHRRMLLVNEHPATLLDLMACYAPPPAYRWIDQSVT